LINNDTNYAIKTGGAVWVTAAQSLPVSVYLPLDRERLDENNPASSRDNTGEKVAGICNCFIEEN
jgi:hypothetical protein